MSDTLRWMAFLFLPFFVHQTMTQHDQQWATRPNMTLNASIPLIGETSFLNNTIRRATQKLTFWANFEKQILFRSTRNLRWFFSRAYAPILLRLKIDGVDGVDGSMECNAAECNGMESMECSGVEWNGCILSHFDFESFWIILSHLNVESFWIILNHVGSFCARLVICG